MKEPLPYKKLIYQEEKGKTKRRRNLRACLVRGETKAKVKLRKILQRVRKMFKKC